MSLAGEPATSGEAVHGGEKVDPLYFLCRVNESSTIQLQLARREAGK